MCECFVVAKGQPVGGRLRSSDARRVEVGLRSDFEDLEELEGAGELARRLGASCDGSFEPPGGGDSKFHDQTHEAQYAVSPLFCP